jgi:hypothetical protein
MRTIWNMLMLSGALALAGCGSSEGSDAGTALDAVVTVDTGLVQDTGALADTGSGSSDAGAGDTGAPIQTDAGTRDASLAPDALDPADATATVPDATAPDAAAGVRDATVSTPDATAVDATAPDATAVDATAPDASQADSGSSAPTFATVYTTVLSGCGCHSAGAGGLTFGNEQATYNALVNIASRCGGRPLVTPGDPANSVLHDKVANASPACGSRMPRGGRALPAATVQILTDWITAGAPR